MKQAVVRLLITVVAFASIICTPTYAYFCPCCNDTALPGCFEEAETLCNEVVSYGNFNCAQEAAQYNLCMAAEGYVATETCNN